jgi:hypothetical protein
MKFPHYLTLTFIILKLCHYIDWSWWWVTAPLWILCLVEGICAGIKEAKK